MRCSDGVVREVDILLFKKSKLLRDIIEDYLEEDSEILLLKVDSKYLDLIVQYLEHYKDMEPKEIPKPFPERTDDAFLRGIVNDDWTFNYLKNMSIQEAINLINAADYMQIDGLINILAAKIYHEICNCDLEEYMKKCGIETNLTEEEIAEIDIYPLD